MIKQSKRLNGDLKPEYKKTTNGTTMGPTTNTADSRYLELAYFE